MFARLRGPQLMPSGFDCQVLRLDSVLQCCVADVMLKLPGQYRGGVAWTDGRGGKVSMHMP